MKNTIVTICMIALLTGCGGRAANPVMPVQYGDEKKSCKSLERELMFIQQEIQRLIPETDKTGKNVALGVTGFFFLVPLFFMDLSQAEQQEVTALRQRYTHLAGLADDKSCMLEMAPVSALPEPEAQTLPNQTGGMHDPRGKTRNR